MTVGTNNKQNAFDIFQKQQWVKSSLGLDVDLRYNFGVTLRMNAGGNDKQNAFDFLM